MSFLSVLSAIGGDVKKVFSWIGSPEGQTVISTGEAAAVAIDPALGGLVTLGNTILTEAMKVEALAAAAGSQNGSGPQKLTAVVAAVTPQVLAYASKAGLPTPDATKIQNAVNGIVAFANALEGKSGA